MSDKIKSLSPEMQRVIDLGLLDHWLRGLSEIIPRALARHPRDHSQEFNTHLIAYNESNGISSGHIQKLVGCRQLLTGCSQQNIGVDIKLIENGHLCVSFKPEHQFVKSLVFGASYHNVLPSLFGLGVRKPK